MAASLYWIERGQRVDFRWSPGLIYRMATAAVPKRQPRRLWTFDELAAKLDESNSPTELVGWRNHYVSRASTFASGCRVEFRYPAQRFRPNQKTG